MKHTVKIIFISLALMHILYLPAWAVFNEDAVSQNTADEIAAKRQTAQEEYNSQLQTPAEAPRIAVEKIETQNTDMVKTKPVKKLPSSKSGYKNTDIVLGFAAVVLAIIASLALIVYNKTRNGHV